MIEETILSLKKYAGNSAKFGCPREQTPKYIVLDYLTNLFIENDFESLKQFETQYVENLSQNNSLEAKKTVFYNMLSSANCDSKIRKFYLENSVLKKEFMESN